MNSTLQGRIGIVVDIGQFPAAHVGHNPHARPFFSAEAVFSWE